MLAFPRSIRAGSLFDFNSLFPSADRFFSHPTQDEERQFPINAQETAEGIVVTAEVPGILKEDLIVSLEQGILEISGTKSCESSEEDKEYCIMERYSGKFTRRLRLSEDMDESSITAGLKNGILTLKVKRREEVQPKKVLIE